MTRRALLLFLVFLLALAGCASFLGPAAPVETPPPPPSQLLENAVHLQKTRKFSDAIGAYRRIVKEHPGSDLAAAARYNIALVFVDAENPEKDYAQALVEFEEFIAQFPQNTRADEAKSWRQAIKLALEAKKENERLSKNIERLKQLDVKQEEKRSGR